VLRLPPIDLRVPASAAEAAVILASEGPRARAVAGGTDLWPNMKRRHQSAETVVSLMGIPDLRGTERRNGDLRIGATTSLSAVVDDRDVRERYPALARAVASISSPPLRNMGTIGGNLCVDTRCTYYNQTEEWRRSIDYCLKEQGEICWVATRSPRCWAHSASDSAPMLCALDARVRLASGDGEREIAAAALFADDGIDYLTKTREEILTDVLVPASADATRCRSAFWKLRRRGSIDFSVFSVAVALWMDGDAKPERCAVWLNSVASWPLRVEKAEALLLEEGVTEESIAKAARLARTAATPMDNTDFAPAWRGKMVERYTEAALREAAGLPVERPAPRHFLL